MSSENTNVRSLRAQIRNSMIKAISEHYFLPDVSLSAILTFSTIESIVEGLVYPADEKIALSEKIYREGRKMFAILVLMGEEASIVAFRNHNTLDQRLPLDENYSKRIAPDFGISLAREFQWKVLPFHFTVDMWQHHWEVEKERIVPFVGSEDVATGGFGDIYKVAIWPSQQDFYSKEVKKFYLFLFLGSDAMDLKQLFKDERFGMFKWDFTFFSALRGLASALSNLHRLYLNKADHKVQFEAIGYHHDIRPANVLVSSETFILGDFGMGNYKPIDTPSQTPWKWAIGDYLAPECMDEHNSPQDVGRAIDIWAYGCLLAEVITYMLAGADGVKEFRMKRELRGRVSGWTDCGFYRPDGEVKDEVRSWLERLVPDDMMGGLPYSLLVKLSLQALRGSPKDRPSILGICTSLSFASLKAHFNAVDRQFARYLATESSASQDFDRLSTNNIWFLHERFRAWGHALTLQRPEMTPQMSNTFDELHDRSIQTLVALFQNLADGRMKGPESSWEDEQNLFESAVNELVEHLWDYLPKYLKERAQNYWHQAILYTNDKEILEDLHQRLKKDYIVYDITNAMALMKNIRLEMLRPDSLRASSRVCTLSRDDLEFIPSQGLPIIGRYKKSLSVLIEPIKYGPMWENVDPVQKELVTGLKAKGFSVEPKPMGLRMMKCIGAYANLGDPSAFGLVYEIPPEYKTPPKTLFSYFEQGEGDLRYHPTLGDKFQLAFALVDFLQQFHTIGWLHETFNPHNILFFERSEDQEEFPNSLSFTMIRSPYANAPEGFCIETMMVDSVSEYRLCKKSTHMSFAEQRIVD